MKLTIRDEILSAMVVYGFLTYGEGKVSIPNRELMEKSVDFVKEAPVQISYCKYARQNW